VADEILPFYCGLHCETRHRALVICVDGLSIERCHVVVNPCRRLTMNVRV
jgi:hypothetical protein